MSVHHIDFNPDSSTKKRLTAALFEQAVAIDDLDPTEGIRLYRRVIHLEPSHDAAMANLGRVYYCTGQFGAAESWWMRAIKTNPHAGDAHYNMGYLRLMEKDYVAAVPHFEMAIEVDSSHADAYFNLGDALKEMGRREEARTCWKKHIELRGEYTVEARAALGFRVICGGKGAG